MDVEIGKATYRTGVGRNPEGFVYVKLEMLLYRSTNTVWADRHEFKGEDRYLGVISIQKAAQPQDHQNSVCR